jgi:oxygen-dependent protoporphyrinogen oxidase
VVRAVRAGPASLPVSNVVIIGAGISGLAAAWELKKRGLHPLILERSGRAGGVILTDRAEGFVVDAGPDSLLVQKPAAVQLCRELGLGDRLFPTLLPRTAFVLKHGQLVPLPEASFLGLPARVGPFVRSRLFSAGAKLRMATELLRSRRPTADESIAQFIGRRFGREAVDYLAEPLLAGIHAGDVTRLSVHSLFPRLVALEQSHGSILRGLWGAPPDTAASKGAFVSLPGGIAELPEALVSALGPESFRFHARVRQISGRGPYKLTLDTDEAIQARVVIVTAPAWSAAQMLASLDTMLGLRCADIPYASTATIAYGLRREQIGHALQGSGFVVPRRERKLVMAGTWVSSKWPQRAPEGHVLLRAFVGGATDPGALQRNDLDLARLAFQELSKVLDITGDPMLVRLFRWVRATPQYTVGHADRIAAIEERLARYPGMFLTGSGYRGTGIPDCVADARVTAAKAAVAI